MNRENEVEALETAREKLEGAIIQMKNWMEGEVTKEFMKFLDGQISGREKSLLANPIKTQDGAFEASFLTGEVRAIRMVRLYPGAFIAELQEQRDAVVKDLLTDEDKGE